MGATDLASPSPDIRRARIPVSQEGEWFVDGAETNEWFSDFSDVFKHPPSPTPERQEPARTSTAPSREAPLGPKPTFWALPLQSLVLDAPRDVTLPLNFLNVYPAILRKFPGPPIEALGRTISYLQALFTESPGFHPFITHLSTDSPPASEFVGKRVAEDLERRLIRIVQNLFSFFHGDVNIVKQYLDECPAELIPVLSSSYLPPIPHQDGCPRESTGSITASKEVHVSGKVPSRKLSGCATSST